jgi:transglutaminase-like putative cysteine protease
MVYRTLHTTLYSYEGPVSSCLTEVRLTPRTLPGRQEIRHFRLRVLPEPATLDKRHDYYGNEVWTFSVVEPHDRLTVTAVATVELSTPPDPSPSDSPAWEEVAAALRLAATQEALEAGEFRWESPYVPHLTELAEYARRSFAPHRPILEAAHDLTGRIYRDFKYAPRTTSIETPLADVLKQRRGVCQDFAHAMIGALRSMGLAARYVSGYLKSGAQYTGAEASHAWVSVFVPGRGWFDFDPTNDVIPSTGHVTLAWGRDYGDVTPVKGVTTGGGEQLVQVEVRVQPV